MAGEYDFEEQERIAELKAWWEDNRMMVFGIVGAAILGFGGFQGWRHWNGLQAAEAAAMFQPVAEASRAGDADKVAAAADPLIDQHGGSFYASEAALIAAKAAFDAGKLDAAREKLEWVMRDGAPAHRSIARVRLSSVLLQQQKYDDALKVLDGTTDPAFAALAADARGDVMLAQGRLDEARAAYRLAIEKAGERHPVRVLVETKLNALGGAR